ncbi:hypothetical protein E2986_00644 [Frieseomelitta varia]|uniref:non-specific serine/threonine protein kinase n=1 Tax=Frieseomelitta varia TaxID=561572 RepID=A0A833S2K0_9HYME|nr:hypothetical protein E2986_00644 [Frieseomelitta varia]
MENTVARNSQMENGLYATRKNGNDPLINLNNARRKVYHPSFGITQAHIHRDGVLRRRRSVEFYKEEAQATRESLPPIFAAASARPAIPAQQQRLPHGLEAAKFIARSKAAVDVKNFGFAQYLSNSEQKFAIRGSPLYMAPEILLKHKYDARVDLWSVGVIMYECLFGKAPYSSGSFQELAEKIKDCRPIERDIDFLSTKSREKQETRNCIGINRWV